MMLDATYTLTNLKFLQTWGRKQTHPCHILIHRLAPQTSWHRLPIWDVVVHPLH